MCWNRISIGFQQTLRYKNDFFNRKNSNTMTLNFLSCIYMQRNYNAVRMNGWRAMMLSNSKTFTLVSDWLVRYTVVAWYYSVLWSMQRCHGTLLSESISCASSSKCRFLWLLNLLTTVSLWPLRTWWSSFLRLRKTWCHLVFECLHDILHQWPSRTTKRMLHFI